ncbi:hypothetical protein [Gemmatimonas sp.]|uniref:LVIVD repeat-containing protein n=1 Tax=Gemmatimonas sp. TaxID=1962908 RepID=UPI00286D7E29|nr:hypothetical protein [Gemmatimonas sp.]
MTRIRFVRRLSTTVTAVLAVIALSACGGGESAPTQVTKPADTTTTVPPPPLPGLLTHLGQGAVPERYTAEVWVRGTTAYTTTWGTRAGSRGNAVKIWDVSADQPQLLDNVFVANATTTGDVQVSDDGSIMLVAIEANPNGGVAIYSMANPRAPQLITRTTGGELQYGVHTAELARVNGVLYAFCAVNQSNGVSSRLVVLDLSTPSAPRTVWSQAMGNPFVHDVFVREGLLFTAEWNDGVGIWDIGAQGGTVSAPRLLGRARTVGGQAHNAWWVHDPVSQTKKYLLVGQEGPGAIGSSSVGDVHVVDISNLAAPVEVAVYSVPGAGTHNFSVDEAQGFAYAAFYNGGVRVLDVRGDLATCTVAQKTTDGRCDLAKMSRERASYVGTGGAPVYVWGVHWSPSGLFASDMLNGLWRAAPATR